MLLDRGKHTTKCIDILLVTVGTDMEPGILLSSYLHRRFLQTKHLLATKLLKECEILPQT